MNDPISEHFAGQLATMMADIKRMADELAEVRALLAANNTQRTDEKCLAKTKAEMALVDAMGLDPATYLKNKYKKYRSQSVQGSKRKSRSSRH